MRNSAAFALFAVVACYNSGSVADSHLEDLFASPLAEAAESVAPSLWQRAADARALSRRAARAQEAPAAADHRTAARLWLTAAIVRTQALRLQQANAERLAAADRARDNILAMEAEARRYEDIARAQRAQLYGEATAASAYERAQREEPRRARQTADNDRERDIALAAQVRRTLTLAQALGEVEVSAEIENTLRAASARRVPADIREKLDRSHWAALSALTRRIRDRGLASCRDWIAHLPEGLSGVVRDDRGLRISMPGLLDPDTRPAWIERLVEAPRPSVLILSLNERGGEARRRVEELQADLASNEVASSEMQIVQAVDSTTIAMMRIPCL